MTLKKAQALAEGIAQLDVSLWRTLALALNAAYPEFRWKVSVDHSSKCGTTWCIEVVRR